MEICSKCGLPQPACVCEQIDKSSQRIRVTTDKKRYGKVVTIVSGFDGSIKLKEIAKGLKNELACGGTVKDDGVELQGDHTKRVKAALVKLGFDEESIDE
jgi:translation initiation factor 1